MKQKGFILIVSLIFVVILTMLALAMFSGLTTDETMSGNFREKNRSLDAAQAALNVAENWMLQPGNTYTGDWVGNALPVFCAGVQTIETVCTYPITNPSNTAGVSTIVINDPTTWTAYYTPNLAGMTVNSAGGSNTYAGSSKFYIQYLGATNINPPTAMYQVTATAMGGNATATTVVQAVYQITALSRDIGQQ
jgi:type IV pilus assembly protein PilX